MLHWKPLLFTISLLSLHSCAQISSVEETRINGVSFEAPSREIGIPVMDEIRDSIYADWVCLMPYAYGQANKASISFEHGDWQWWGEQKTGIQTCIELAKSSGLQVMLKPHIWMGQGQFTGDLDFDTQAEWDSWNQSYETYILSYALLAEKCQVEIFCIGTELHTPVIKNTTFWSDLIQKVRRIFSGRLTYAGNWDSYRAFPYWHKLDYIGVDAYFPISEERHPSVQSCINGWNKWMPELKQLSDSTQKEVLFTEYGYRSIDFCAKEPWSIERSTAMNQSAQANAYEALFRSIWQEKWVAGGFLWKWHAPGHRNKEKQSTSFTPQGKKAISVIKQHYH